MSLKIFGAGMAGLLAAHMLRRHSPVIHEAQPKLPQNHKALLRFRTNKVSLATGIPFKQVQVLKGIWTDNQLKDRATLSDNNQYSLKVTGSVRGRSIMNLAPAERFIAPEDFIERLAEGLDIRFSSPMTEPEPGISTIPMPTLMRILNMESGQFFKAKEIWAYNAEIVRPEVDLYQTVYIPDPNSPVYRVSITGKRVTVETMNPGKDIDYFYIQSIVEDIFGIPGLKLSPEVKFGVQKFGKLLPIDEEARRAFILYATDKYGIYSAGRFATWRQILLDDVVKDLEWIDRVIGQRDKYEARLGIR